MSGRLTQANDVVYRTKGPEFGSQLCRKISLSHGELFHDKYGLGVPLFFIHILSYIYFGGGAYTLLSTGQERHSNCQPNDH